MPEKKWTPEQLDAITSRGGTLLVSAAAGSGKTAVLVERVIRRLTGPDPCDADRLLVVTFTNAAAAEMKERISLRLAELAAAHPLDRNLQRQQILLQNAHISTIHAFCLELIRENFEKLDISPDFRIADENEIRLLSRDVLDQILEEQYAAAAREGKTNAFLTLAGTVGAGRDDSLLEDTVLRLYDFARSLPDPEGWLDDMLRMYDSSVPAGRTVWGLAALRHVRQTMESAVRAIDVSLGLMEGYEPLVKGYRPAFLSDRRQARACADAAAAGDWDAAFRAVAGFTFDPLGAVRKLEPVERKETLQARRKDLKATVERLRAGVLGGDSARVAGDIRTVYPLAVCLHDLVLQLDRRLFAAKLERDILDFSDLEQLALRLLYEHTESGPRPSPTARAVAGRFEEVLVDEYQDTNRAQDAIFRAVSRQGRNLFMVGDVKQSIYRFRKATPELFMEKKAAYAPYGEGRFPARVTLGRNFRSRPGVTAAVNFVFSQLMSEQFGEIEYGREEQLIPAAAYPERPGADFALHIVDAADEGETEDTDTREARHIASLITDMVRGGFPVQGEDGPRPARFRDFCILLRSTSGRAETYRRELERAGVPVFADVNGGYLGSYEVGIMLSLLRILDNPLQDVPLLSVMLSPVFGFTPDDLARVRIRNCKGSLYLAVAAAARAEGGRLGEFVDAIASLRRLAVALPADRLILRIYADLSVLEICGAMPGGAARRANLRLLLDYARSYEAAGYKGLAGFIRYIDRLGEQDGDLVPASALSENADVVRIMSIHKSKGLEFPVCILGGCARKFNMVDTQSAALFHPEYGFGCTVRDPSLGCRYTTLPREVIRIETARSTLAEEMRVLYVAMTRAKEKLICVMSPSRLPAQLRRAAALIRPGETRLDPLAASQARNFAEWLLACALRHPDAAELRRLAGCEDLPLLPAAAPMEIRLVTPGAEAQRAPSRAAQAALPASPAGDTAALAGRIRERIAFRYPGEGLTRVPSKLAVSEFAEEESREQFGFHGSRPPFLSHTGLTPAQAGTALHAFLQYADLSAVAACGDVAGEVGRLVARKFLLPEQGEAVRSDRVMAYLASDIYARIRAADRVWKEFRFTTETDAAEVSDAVEPGQGTVVLQGMADVVFEEKGRLYILDYKTDAADEAQLRQRYAQQLAVYARAVAQIMGQEVAACYIYGFHEGKTIAV